MYTDAYQALSSLKQIALQNMLTGTKPWKMTINFICSTSSPVVAEAQAAICHPR